MQVNCPNCGAKVTAENINIQNMTAVCAACDTVFRFDLPGAETEIKAKRRKVKQPPKLTLHDAETLQMEFWTNFRLDRDEAFSSSIIGGVLMTFLALVVFAAGVEPSIIPLIFLLSAFGFFYRLALVVVNKTHIEMDEDTITIARKPIPSPLDLKREVSLAGVEAIKYEETAISKKESYDTPRYTVWAETVDGSRRIIVNDVTEEYAVFIAQSLQERLYMDAEPDVSRLQDDGQILDDEMDMSRADQSSPNEARR